MENEKPKSLIMFAKNREKEIANYIPDKIKLKKFMDGINLAILDNPDLAKCSKESFLIALYNAAEVGLPLTPVLGLAHFIKYGNKIQYQISYKGFIVLYTSLGITLKHDSCVVYEKDHFEIIRKGDETTILHKPFISRDRGKIICVYEVAKCANGEIMVEWIIIDELEKIRSLSNCPDSPAYTNFLNEMYRKMVTKRLRKRLPARTDIDTTKLDKAIKIDSEHAGISFEIPNLLDPEKNVEELKEKPKKQRGRPPKIETEELLGNITDSDAGYKEPDEEDKYNLNVIKIGQMSKLLGWDNDKLNNEVSSIFDIDYAEELNLKQQQELIKIMQKMLEPSDKEIIQGEIL